MPSAGSCSNSDVDCGSAVRYTLQCEYPERPHFGPDKFGAFFGDVELGRIVQEEHGEPAPCTSTATPSPLPVYQQFTPTSQLTRTGSLYTGSASASDHSSSSTSQFERASSPQNDRSSSYVAEHASFVNEYSELNEDPDLRRNRKSGIRTGSDTQSRVPPDYVRISAVLLVIAPPCAGVALYWALKAKKHMKRGQNGQAWQLSNKAFYCLLLGLLCFMVVLISWSIARLVIQFRNNYANSMLTVDNSTFLSNPPQYDAEIQTRLHESVEIRKKHQDQSQKEPIFKLVTGATNPGQLAQTENVDLKQSRQGQFSTSTQAAGYPERTGSGVDAVRGPKPDVQHVQQPGRSDSRGRIAEIFPDVVNGSTGDDSPKGESQGATFDSQDEIPAEQVPKVTRELFNPVRSSRTPAATGPRISEQSYFDMFLNNGKQLPEETTTINPRYLRGVPVESEQAAGQMPRQMRHRRNVRQRPRGRRKLT